MSEEPPVDRERLLKAFRRLPRREREIFFLAAVEDRRNDEIARRLGLPAAEVERQLARAIVRWDRALRRCEHPWWRFW